MGMSRIKHQRRIPESEHEAALAQEREKVERIHRAVWALDLSDDYTIEQTPPGELISCTRPVEQWIELREALATLTPSLRNGN
jgi:hypothetical protein